MGTAMKKSCETCKARKVRCDRREPSCGWCFQNNRVCVYMERKKPGVPARSEMEIEQRVHALESNIQALTRRVDNRSSNLYERTRQSDTSGEGQFDESPSIVDGGDRVSPLTEQSFLTSAHDGIFSSRHSGPPSIHSALDMVLGSGSDNLSPNVGLVDSVLLQSDLPPYNLMQNLVDLFFKHIIIWAPILTQNSVHAILSVPYFSLEDSMLLHAIVTTTIRFSQDPTLTPDARARYHRTSKQKVQIFVLENTSVTALQALVLLALDALGTSDGPEGWKLLTLLGQSVVHMGLSREKSVFLDSSSNDKVAAGRGRSWPAVTLSQPHDWIEEEGRRRLVWLVYMLDRYTTVGTHSNFVLGEYFMNLPLPCRFDSFSNNESAETKWFRGLSASWDPSRNEQLGSFSYHCEVLMILSEIHHLVGEPLDVESPAVVHAWRNKYRLLDGRLNKWLSELPEHATISQLCHSDPAARVSNWIMIHAAFILSVIRLHSTAAYPVVKSQYFPPSNNAMQRCLAVVESLRGITLDVIQTGALHLLGFPYAFILWTAARLLIVHSAVMKAEIDQTIWFFITALEAMSQCWPVAGSYSKILRQTLHRGDKNRIHSTSSAIGDHGVSFELMRRRAFELTNLTSRSRNTIHDQISSHILAPGDLDSLEVFCFFDYPVFSSSIEDSSTASITSAANTLPSGHFGLANDTDWRQSPHQGSSILDHPDGSADFGMVTPESDLLDFKPSYNLKTGYL